MKEAKQKKNNSDGTRRGAFIQRKPHGNADHSETPFISSSVTANAIQPKLAIGQPGDQYEREADQMADRVIRMPLSNTNTAMINHSPTNGMQRMCNDCDEEIQRQANDPSHTHASTEVSHQIKNRNGRGEPLSQYSRMQLENAFGADFSSVRVHRDSESLEMSQQLNAQAFTYGSDIYFNKGYYDPASISGMRLLAHELTHVVQQNSKNIIRRQPRRRRIDQVRRTKLSLFQFNDRARSHFQTHATHKAREIGAIMMDTSEDCPEFARVGPSPFHSGADILEILHKAHVCTGRPVEELHVFSHGFEAGGGIVAAPVERRGLVTRNLRVTASDRRHGARQVDDIQTDSFADNAVIVLHGCEIGAGDDSFAEQMLRRLVGAHSEVRIFAHSISGMCGRTRDWREFNADNPDGRRIRVNPFHRPVIQRTPLEEEQLLQQPAVSVFISGSALQANIQQLNSSLQQAPSYTNAQNAVVAAGTALWQQAAQISQQGQTDDRPLYWIRLRMRQAIHQFNPGSQFTMSAAQRNTLINDFEAASRGMPPAGTRLSWNSGVKKILISGFDPFALYGPLGNIRQDNPSGAAVLALDNREVRHPVQTGLVGQIQGVILPVRYSYFDRGNIEQFFRPYIHGPNGADMVMTISQGGGPQGNPPVFELEEYGSRYRNPYLDDNERELGGTAALPPGPEFTQSSLPRARMRRDALGRANPGPSVEEGAFSGIDSTGQTVPRPSAAHPDPWQLTRATGGSGGTYLSNEIFYRTSLLRDNAPTPLRRHVPVGHLHVPIVEEAATHRHTSLHLARAWIINMVRRLITAALPDL